MNTPKVVEISTPPAVKRGIVDEFGRLEAELKAIRPKEERREQLAKTIRGWFDSEAGDQDYTVEGDEFTVEVGKKAEQRTIKSLWAIYRRFGIREFLKMVTLPLKELDSRLAPIEVDLLVVKARTGTRRLKPTQKALENAA